jgi:hypothetical protein
MQNIIKIEVSLSYDSLRKTVYLITGEILTDEKIIEMTKGETLKVQAETVKEIGEDFYNVLGALVLMQTEMNKKKDYPVKKSKFQERLEAMEKQQKEARKF